MAVVAPHPDGKQFVINYLRQLANEIEVGTVEPTCMSQQADVETVSGLHWEESRYTGHQSLQLDYYRRQTSEPALKAPQDSTPAEPDTYLSDCLTLLTAYRDRCAELVSLGLRGLPATDEVDAVIQKVQGRIG